MFQIEGFLKPLSVREVQKDLLTQCFGRTLYAFPTLDSTNRFAKDLVHRGLPEGTLVIAEHQTEGKGRLGRSWVSPPFLGLTFSVLLFPKKNPDQYPLLSLAFANAIVNAVQQVLGIEAKVKWPNDILLKGRKVAGILSEMIISPNLQKGFILGVGVNVNGLEEQFPVELQHTVTSLRMVKGTPVQREAFLSVLINQLEKWYDCFQEGQASFILEQWKNSSETMGKTVKVYLPQGCFYGIAKDLEGDGALILEKSNGEKQTIHSGDIVHIRTELGDMEK